MINDIYFVYFSFRKPHGKSSERNFLQIIQLFVNSLTLVADIASLPELSKNCHSCLLALPSP